MGLAETPAQVFALGLSWERVASAVYIVGSLDAVGDRTELLNEGSDCGGRAVVPWHNRVDIIVFVYGRGGGRERRNMKPNIREYYIRESRVFAYVGHSSGTMKRNCICSAGNICQRRSYTVMFELSCFRFSGMGGALCSCGALRLSFRNIC